MNSGRGVGGTGLERALVELGSHIEWPPEPDLASAVRLAIRRGPQRRPDAVWRFRRRALTLATASLVLIATLTLSFSPAARDAVADFLGIGGVRISYGRGPTPTASPGKNLALGRVTNLADARSSVDFQVAVPTLEGVEDPDRVYVATTPPGGRVSLVYDADELLPAADETGLGMIVTEFRSTIEEDFAKKLIDGQATLRLTEVDGGRAFWVRGPHTVYLYRDSNGRVREDTLRLAGNALLWQRGDVTVRLESALDLGTARRIAESMR